MNAISSRRTPGARPSYELLLVIGLPLAVLIASAVTLALALDHGFTPMPAIEHLVGTR